MQISGDLKRFLLNIKHSRNTHSSDSQVTIQVKFLNVYFRGARHIITPLHTPKTFLNQTFSHFMFFYKNI